ncbi:MAG: response regulator [Coleofasciculaceae cyanobacterium]
MNNLQLDLCCKHKPSGFIYTHHAAIHSLVAKPTILVVDDDEDNLLLLSYALEPLNCAILTAVDGVSALSLCRTYRPDLILLDVLMPYMDGTEVVSQLRKEPVIKTTPVIAVTACATAKDRERLLLAGFNDYISKPYMLEDIEALVCRFLPARNFIS